MERASSFANVDGTPTWDAFFRPPETGPETSPMPPMP
jgi:hypothetical protein